MKNNKAVSNKNTNRKISLPALIAYNATPQAQKLIVQFGKLPAKNYKELQVRLAQIINEFGDEGLKAISKIHPDRDLILDYNAIKMEGGDRGDGYYYGFNTNFRPEYFLTQNDGIQGTIMGWDIGNAGYKMASGTQANVGKGKKIIGVGGVILSLLALGLVITAFGERKRTY